MLQTSLVSAGTKNSPQYGWAQPSAIETCQIFNLFRKTKHKQDNDQQRLGSTPLHFLSEINIVTNKGKTAVTAADSSVDCSLQLFVRY